MKIEIELTHNLGDNVCFLKDDKITSGTIYKIEVSIDEQGHTEFLFIKTNDYNSVVIRPHKAFYSRQELIESL